MGLRPVAALRGIRFDPSGAGPIASLLAPPYDVVTRDRVPDYLARSPYNVIRLDLGLSPEPSSEPGAWEHAASLFRGWLRQGVLRADGEPAAYVVRHRYTLFDGEEKSLSVVMAGLRAGPSPHRAALPHERIVDSVRDERLRQIQVCRAYFSPILALVSDPERALQDAVDRASEGPAALHAEAPTGGHLDVWVEPVRSGVGQALMNVLAALVEAQPAIIADGHHRFEAASRYADLVQESTDHAVSGTGPLPGYVLAGFASLEHGGLSILAVHRLVGPPSREVREALRLSLYEHLSPLSVPELPDGVREACEAAGRDPFQAVEALTTLRRRLGRTAFAAYWGRGELEFLAPPAKALWAGGGRGRDAETGAAFDVAVLHRGPLQHWRPAADSAARGRAQAAPGWVEYTADPREALAAVDTGRVAAAILLNPVTMDEVRHTAAAGKRMPEKSTYFYPKLTSGLVLCDLDLPWEPWPKLSEDERGVSRGPAAP